MNGAGTATDGAAAARFDLFEVPDDYFESPFEYFRALRNDDPIHPNSDGTVLLTRYDDVRQVWREPSASVDKEEMFARKFGPGPLLDHHVTGMLFRDPPDHARLRRMVNPSFATAQIERLSSFVEELVEQLLDEALERQSFDFVEDFAARIPIAVITRILGVPAADGAYLRDLGLRVLFPLNPHVPRSAIEAGNDAAAEFSEYLAEHIGSARGRDFGDPETVVETLVAAERDQAGGISEQEIVAMCLLLLNGGHETSTNLIAVGTGALLDDPAELRRWREDADSLRQPVEEVIRFVSPLQLQGRRLTQPITLSNGEELPAGTETILCQASANRDERAFEQPDELDLTRRPNAHVAFGLGAHVCIGRPLARLEAGVAFQRIAARLPMLQRDGVPEWNQNVRFRGVSTMPVRVG